jgi:hypothetical protein
MSEDRARRLAEILAAADVIQVRPPGPCNRRCRERGHCAFRVADPPGFCRERKPPVRAEIRTLPDPGATTR